MQQLLHVIGPLGESAVEVGGLLAVAFVDVGDQVAQTLIRIPQLGALAVVQLGDLLRKLAGLFLQLGDQAVIRVTHLLALLAPLFRHLLGEALDFLLQPGEIALNILKALVVVAYLRAKDNFSNSFKLFGRCALGDAQIFGVDCVCTFLLFCHHALFSLNGAMLVIQTGQKLCEPADVAGKQPPRRT
ncbi:MAG: hypothetical protein KDD83_04455 [Caldilineaceae bacterium]|nr:hypothetical protein [Caldilineaceae bacterium]